MLYGSYQRLRECLVDNPSLALMIIDQEIKEILIDDVGPINRLNRCGNEFEFLKNDYRGRPLYIDAVLSNEFLYLLD